MLDERFRVYCAGPLFNEKEREEMQQIASTLEANGFEVFLPQRDGLELTKCVEVLVKHGLNQDDAGQLVSCAIFALDVFQVIESCQAIVVNLNGRVPDEGAVSEAAIAWCFGKPLVGYKSDMRSVFLGQDNPLVAGLFNFSLVANLSDVAPRLRKLTSNQQLNSKKAKIRKEEINSYLKLGGKIWKAIRFKKNIDDIAELLLQEKILSPSDATWEPGEKKHPVKRSIGV